MRLLLDTNVLIWWLDDTRPLRDDVRAAIADPEHEAIVSAASVWEISIKIKTGKLQVDADIPDAIERSQFAQLAVTGEHGWAAGALPLHHRDPFDRLLVAQAQLEGLTIVTRDPAIARYQVAVLAA